MAKDFNKMSEDNPVMDVLMAAKEEAKKLNKKENEAVSPFKIETSSATVEIKRTEEMNTVVSEEEKRVLINILIRESTKKEWKLFFTQHDLNMTQGIEVAVGYLMSEVEKGNLKLSKGGITK